MTKCKTRQIFNKQVKNTELPCGGSFRVLPPIAGKNMNEQSSANLSKQGENPPKSFMSRGGFIAGPPALFN